MNQLIHQFLDDYIVNPDHYMLDYQSTGDQRRFAEDCNFLTQLKGLVDNEIQSVDSLDKYVYNHMSESLGRAISRARGDSEV
jgi:hypothetical protein